MTKNEQEEALQQYRTATTRDLIGVLNKAAEADEAAEAAKPSPKTWQAAQKAWSDHMVNLRKMGEVFSTLAAAGCPPPDEIGAGHARWSTDAGPAFVGVTARPGAGVISFSPPQPRGHSYFIAETPEALRERAAEFAQAVVAAGGTLEAPTTIDALRRPMPPEGSFDPSARRDQPYGTHTSRRGR